MSIIIDRSNIDGQIDDLHGLTGTLSSDTGINAALSDTEGLSCTLSDTDTLCASISAQDTINASLTIPATVMSEVYDGSYTFTPGDQAIIVPVALKSMEQNITINPIPSNYGKIVWNGSEIKII